MSYSTTSKPNIIVNQDISYQILGHYTKEDLNNLVLPFYTAFNYSTRSAPTNVPDAYKATSGVTLYKLFYNTNIPELGKKVQVSGIVAVPDMLDGSSAGLVSWQHGTVLSPDEVDSRVIIPADTNNIFSITTAAGETVTSGSAETLFNIALLAGNKHFIVTGADYLGLGDSTAPEAYFVKNPTVVTTLDQLSSTNEFLNTIGIQTDKLFLNGWSQGALNTQWLSQKLQLLNVPITASAYAAPPTDLVANIRHWATEERQIPQNPHAPPVWIAVAGTKALQSYEDYFKITNLIDTAIKPQYHSLIMAIINDPNLVDWFRSDNNTIYFNKGKTFTTNDGKSVTEIKGFTAKECFVDGFTDRYVADPISTFFKDLDKASPYNWTYSFPAKFYYGTGEEVIPSNIVENSMVFIGSSATPIKVEGADHRGTFLYSLFNTSVAADGTSKNIGQWFSNLDQAQLNKTHLDVQSGYITASGQSYSHVGTKISVVSPADNLTSIIEVRSVASDGSYKVIGSIGKTASSGSMHQFLGSESLGIQSANHLEFARVTENGNTETLVNKIIPDSSGFKVDLFSPTASSTKPVISLLVNEISNPQNLSNQVASTQSNATSDFLNLHKGDALDIAFYKGNAFNGGVSLVKIDQSPLSGLPLNTVESTSPDNPAFQNAVNGNLISIFGNQTHAAGKTYWIAPEDGVYAVVANTDDHKVFTFGATSSLDARPHVQVIGDNLFGFETGVGAGNDSSYNDIIVQVSPDINIGKFISSLYDVAFDRKADTNGFAFWEQSAIDKRLNTISIVDAFMQSTEYLNVFGATVTNDDFVLKLYANSFNRLPSELEKGYWVNQLSHGMGRDVAIANFAASDEMMKIIGSTPDTYLSPA